MDQTTSISYIVEKLVLPLANKLIRKIDAALSVISKGHRFSCKTNV